MKKYFYLLLLVLSVSFFMTQNGYSNSNAVPGQETQPPIPRPPGYLIKSLTGQSGTVYCDPKTRIEDLKETVSALFHIPKEKQRLLCNGKQLMDQKTLADYGIFPPATIVVVETK